MGRLATTSTTCPCCPFLGRASSPARARRVRSRSRRLDSVAGRPSPLPAQVSTPSRDAAVTPSRMTTIASTRNDSRGISPRDWRRACSRTPVATRRPSRMQWGCSTSCCTRCTRTSGLHRSSTCSTAKPSDAATTAPTSGAPPTTPGTSRLTMHPPWHESPCRHRSRCRHSRARRARTRRFRRARERHIRGARRPLMMRTTPRHHALRDACTTVRPAPARRHARVTARARRPECRRPRLQLRHPWPCAGTR